MNIVTQELDGGVMILKRVMVIILIQMDLFFNQVGFKIIICKENPRKMPEFTSILKLKIVSKMENGENTRSK